MQRSSFSLRRRLSTAALLVALASLTGSFLAFLVASSVLRASFDSDLVEAAAVLEARLNQPAQDVQPSLAETLPPRYQTLIINEAGVVVSSSAFTVDLADLKPGWARIESHRVFTVSRPSGGSITVAASTEDIDHSLSVVLLALVSASGLLVVLVCVAFIWVHRRGVVPLERMTKTAMSVASGDRTARVPPDGLPLEASALAEAINNLITAQERALQAEAQTAADQRRFLLDASHELRNPLTALVGWSKLLVAGSVPEDRLQDAYTRLATESGRMHRLTEQLLALSRAESTHTCSLISGDLALAISGAIADHEVIDPSRPVVLDAPDHALVALDPDACVQVSTNLLANFRSHTPEGTTCRLTLVQKSGHWELSYRDDGPGVAEPERVFDRFYQADLSRSTTGSGLGLALVRALVEQAGGTADASSSPGQGFGLVVRLPFAP